MGGCLHFALLFSSSSSSLIQLLKMNLVFGCLAVLVTANLCSAAVKGGRRIIGDSFGQNLHLSKGGGGGAVHHTAVVQDPLTGAPVVVEKVTNVKGGGIKGAGLGAGAAQYAISDGPFGRRVYRVGASAYPYGLSGSDYYSYPASLYTTPRRVLGRKSVLANNLSGLSPIGLSSGLKGGVIADPSLSQFSIGDSQIKTSVFGGRRNLYRTGASSVPYGLSGLDYYSYPRQLLTQRRLSDGFGIAQSPILGGGSLFNAGDSQISSPLDSAIGQEKVTVVETDPLSGGQRVTTTVRRPSGGLKGGNIILSGGQGIGGLRRVKTRPVIQSLQAPVFAAQAPQVISQVKTSAGLIGRNIFGNRAPQLIYVDGGRRFPGIDIIGGSRIGDPRLGYTQLPISTRRFANLGGGLGQVSIDAGATLLSPAQVPFLSSLGKSAPIAKTVGGPLGLAAVGHAPTKTITQEEVVGPAGDSQIITTVTKSDPIGSSKIGGFAAGGPLGLSAVGRGATVVQQEEVVNPITGQVSHVTTTQEIAQDPIEAAISQSALGRKSVLANNLSGLSPIGLSSGLKGGVLADPSLSQFSIGDSQIKTSVFGGRRNLYRTGASSVPYGLSGLDYYSYPRQLLTQRRLSDGFGISQSALGRKSVLANNLSGLGPIGLSSGLKGGVLADPSLSQFSIGDSQIKTSVFGGRRNLYRTGASSVPYGLSGLDYYSYPRQLLTQRRLSDGFGISQSALGDSIISSSPFGQRIVDPIGQSQVSVDPFSGSGLSQVRETSYSDPSTGTITKVTEVSPGGGNVVQQNIADALVQESISSGIGGGYDLGGYLPRLSLLSQYPYDMPDNQLVRSVISSPVFQQQQELEQILVK